MPNTNSTNWPANSRTGARRGPTRPHAFPPRFGSRPWRWRALPPARVAKQLGLRVIDLKRQMERQQAPPAPVVPRSLSFVEVPVAPSPSSPLTTHLELSRPDGTRLCIQAPVATLPLAAMVQAFVEGRACSN